MLLVDVDVHNSKGLFKHVHLSRQSMDVMYACAELFNCSSYGLETVFDYKIDDMGEASNMEVG
jgi:hypothetical protein